MLEIEYMKIHKKRIILNQILIPYLFNLFKNLKAMRGY